MEYLFVHVDNANLYRYYKIGNQWSNSYAIEFIKGDESYRRLYWGDYSYNDDREVIASFFHYLDEKPSSIFPWKIVLDVDSKFDRIIKNAEDEIQARQRC